MYLISLFTYLPLYKYLETEPEIRHLLHSQGAYIRGDLYLEGNLCQGIGGLYSGVLGLIFGILRYIYSTKLLILQRKKFSQFTYFYNRGKENVLLKKYPCNSLTNCISITFHRDQTKTSKTSFENVVRTSLTCCLLHT